MNAQPTAHDPMDMKSRFRGRPQQLLSAGQWRAAAAG